MDIYGYLLGLVLLIWLLFELTIKSIKKIREAKKAFKEYKEAKKNLEKTITESKSLKINWIDISETLNYFLLGEPELQDEILEDLHKKEKKK